MLSDDIRILVKDHEAHGPTECSATDYKERNQNSRGAAVERAYEFALLQVGHGGVWRRDVGNAGVYEFLLISLGPAARPV